VSPRLEFQRCRRQPRWRGALHFGVQAAFVRAMGERFVARNVRCQYTNCA
jgi:hypothetical protein